MPKKIKYCIDSLKYNEYYDMQNVFDELYKKSKENFKFSQLMDIILSENNILLAYRNIKTNGRGIIPGTDNQNIRDISKMQPDEVIKQVRYIVRGSKHGYRPKTVRKKEILKAALCPQDTFSVDYNDFVEKRKSILLEYAQELIK